MNHFDKYLSEKSKSSLRTKPDAKGSFNGESGLWYTVWEGDFERDYMVFMSKENVYLFKDDSAEESAILKSRKGISSASLDAWVNDQVGK